MQQKLTQLFSLRLWMLLATLVGGVLYANADTTVTYTISSKNTLSTTGTAPAGSSASIVETYNTTKQMTSGNNQTLTLTGFNGYVIKSIKLNMKSNASGGAGKLSYSTDGGTTYTYLVGSSSSGVAFNNSAWHGSYTNSYIDVTKSVEITPTTTNFIIKIEATANSLYCQSYTLTYAANLPDANISMTTTDVNLLVGGTVTRTATSETTGAVISYASNASDVATVNAATGEVTAVSKGTATITATASADGYADATASYTVVVHNPSHTVTFSANGNTFDTNEVEEGDDITFPASTPSDVNGFSFVGWLSETIDGTTDDEPTFVTEATMSTTDLTYYAVYADADISYSESEIEKTQTLEYDTWTYSGSTTNKTTYRLFHNGSYVESAAFDLSLLKKVVVKGGTFGGGGYNTLTIGDGTNTWKNVTVSGSSETGDNEYTGGTALSGTKALRVQSTCGSSSGSGTGVRISKVEIYTKKRTATYSDYCTTVTALPIPVITMADVTMTWGETGKAVAPSSTINGVAYDGAFIFTVDDDKLTVASNGALSCDTPGSYTVTASIAATAEHQEASTTCTVTVQKKAVTLSFANATVRKNTSDATYTQTATVSPAAYDGTISYSKEDSSTSTGATVNSATAAVAFSNTGSVIVKASASATDLYNAATHTYTILVQTDPTISVSDQSVAYGKTYTLDTNSFLSGDVTISSSNSHIASIDGLVITAAAVGTATITVTAAESDTYTATTETFTFTVTAPTAASSNSEAKETIFYESFDGCSGTGGNDGTWSSTAGSGEVGLDNDWTLTDSRGGGNKCIKLASGSNSGSITTPSLSTTKGTTYTLTFKAGSWKDKSSTLSLSGDNTKDWSRTSCALENEKFNNYTITFTAKESKTNLTFTAAKNNQLFLDEVRIFRPITSTSVTTSGGLATYCYQYPLDLDGISGAKAYVVSNVDVENSRVTLTQITGSIKGGVPFILKSDGDDATFDIPLADESTDEPASNMLVGTLAPTFVEQTSGDDTNFAYSKSNGCFVKLGAAGNTVPANRAYLPINLGSGSVKSFTLSFDITDGIDGTQAGNGKSSDGTCYTLTGQRLAKPQRGINIVGGRKVIIK